jgi:hypothetical protein
VYWLPYWMLVALFHTLQTHVLLQSMVYCHVKGIICMSVNTHKMWVNFRVLKHNTCGHTLDDLRMTLGNLITFCVMRAALASDLRLVLSILRDILLQLRDSKRVVSWLSILVDSYKIDFSCNGCILVDMSSLRPSTDWNLALRSAQKATFGVTTVADTPCRIIFLLIHISASKYNM